MTRRLVFICNNLNIGGPQKGLVALLDRLDPQEFSCTVISLQPGGSLRRYLSERFRVLDVSPLALSLQVNRATVGHDLGNLIRRRLVLAALMYVGALVAAAMRRPVNPWRQRVWFSGRGALSPLDEEFDAAFAVSSGLSTYYMVDCVKARQKYHWVIGDYSRTPIARAVDLRYFRETTGGLSVSRECSDIFAGVFPELGPAPRPFTFPVPWRFFAANEGSGTPEFDGHKGHRVVTVTRLDAGKGLPLALSAARILLDRGLDLRWVILGDGDQRRALAAQISSLSLEPAVRLCGFKNNVSEYLRAADVFVLPSTSEGRSTAVDEAMALGVVPVLTNFRTARSQVTDGVTGLISGFSAPELADCIVRALEPSVRTAIQERLLNYSEDDPNPVFRELSS